MPGENLTRAEAIERKSLVQTQSYEVALDLTTGPDSFRSSTVVRFTATPGTATFIDAITEQVHLVVLNGVALDPAEVADGTRIALSGLAADNVLEVVADFAYSTSGEGLHRFVDPVDGEVYLYSQFEVPDSRRVFAVFEQPDLKATFAFTVTAPESWVVVSNQPAVSAEAGVWTFSPTPVISSYITAIVAGPYVDWRDELTSSDGRTIPLGVFARRSLAEHVDADYVFEKTKQGFAYYESKFGVPYPFEKYDQLFVPEFNAGAMENAGAVTILEGYVFRGQVPQAQVERRAITVLHELAHMWFGDLVTMRWWNDLWLNESFAEWASTIATAEATEWTEAWTTFQAMEKTWAYRQDQLPSTHPISATINDLEDVQVNFDGITYAKGGSVLKQLAAWVGVDAFFAGVGNYFRKHAHGNTELRDLLVELEATSGRDLSGWSQVWLETAGVNTLRPEIAVSPEGGITAFAILQEAPAEWPTLRPHRLGVGFYDLVDAPDGLQQLTRSHYVEIDVDGARTEVPELVGRARPALVLVNDEDLAYAKIRLDEVSLGNAIQHLGTIADPLARALVWGAAWDATRDAETRPSDYISLVLGNIATETESTTIRTTLTQLLTAAKSYVDPARRPETIASVGTALWELARAAEPGGDAQFQFVKFFAAIASNEAHAAVLRDLLDGRLELEGLEVDTDLAWELLEGLVVIGSAGEPEIEAQLASDPSAKGQQAATRLRAAVPTVEAKQRAFASLADSAELSNELQRSVTLGFGHVNDPAVLEPLVAPYFAALEDVWNSRSYKLAEFYAVGLYPSPLVSPGLVAATKDWLDTHPGIPALRRLVVEGLAGVERSIRAQERDRAE
ncbi:MAG: aminopeptidase N [Microbacteriaceae bacterium]|nr:aminopeptidase N [Microbacteriaceae bacterium]